MIYSKIENLNKYLNRDIYCKIECFFKKISKDMLDGEYLLDGEKIFARVMSYNTKPSNECRIEAHDKYIDIQVSIIGAEGIGIYNRDNLIEETSYDSLNDVAFYQRNGAVQNAYSVNIPGYFTMLFPEDAHSPQEQVLSFDKVKKLVIKIAVEQED